MDETVNLVRPTVLVGYDRFRRQPGFQQSQDLVALQIIKHQRAFVGGYKPREKFLLVSVGTSINPCQKIAGFTRYSLV